MNTGLQWLHETFNATPSVGWQIDPFGMNHYGASLHNLFGYKHLVLNRVGDDRRDELKKRGDLDFIWKPSQIFEKSSQKHATSLDSILVHTIPIHYEEPSYKDVMNRFSGSDVDQVQIRWFYHELVKKRLKYYKTRHQMILLGSDFGY